MSKNNFEIVSVRVHPGTKEKITAITGQNFSSVVRQLLKAFIAKYESEIQQP